jgi:hypothetical protein
MPVRELKCETPKCANFGVTYEWFARSMSKADPKCPECHTQMTRLISSFACPWTGTLDRFKEPGMERHQEYGDGHFVWRNRSSRLADGGPEKILVRTRAEQREYCKAEGLIMPDDINPNSEISSDGKTLYTTGMKDQWATGMPDESIRKTGNPWLYVDE